MEILFELQSFGYAHLGGATLLNVASPKKTVKRQVSADIEQKRIDFIGAIFEVSCNLNFVLW